MNTICNKDLPAIPTYIVPPSSLVLLSELSSLFSRPNFIPKDSCESEYQKVSFSFPLSSELGLTFKSSKSC